MKFADIPGQTAIKARLLKSVSESRVSHAQLFQGPEGSGKLAMAIAYAQYINCRQRTPLDSCGECPSCKKYSRLAHPDLHFIYPINKPRDSDGKVVCKDLMPQWREMLSDNKYFITLPEWLDKIGVEKKQGLINIEEAAAINRTLAYKAYEAEYKVMIVWMADKMNHVAANKLLKNIEEPPEKTLFILITEETEELLPTILSRTQLLKFPKLTDEDVATYLATDQEMSPDQASKIVSLADGNLTKARQYGLLMRSNAGEGLPPNQQFVLFRNWMRECYVAGQQLKEYEKLQSTIAELTWGGNREKIKESLTYALHLFHVCLNYHIGNTHLALLDGEELEFVKSFSKFIHPDNIALFDELFNKAILYIERNAAPNIVLTELSIHTLGLLRMPETPLAKKV